MDFSLESFANAFRHADYRIKHEKFSAFAFILATPADRNVFPELLVYLRACPKNNLHGKLCETVRHIAHGGCHEYTSNCAATVLPNRRNGCRMGGDWPRDRAGAGWRRAPTRRHPARRVECAGLHAAHRVLMAHVAAARSAFQPGRRRRSEVAENRGVAASERPVAPQGALAEGAHPGTQWWHHGSPEC